MWGLIEMEDEGREEVRNGVEGERKRGGGGRKAEFRKSLFFFGLLLRHECSWLWKKKKNFSCQ